MRQNKIVVNCVDIAFETWYNNKNSRKGNGIMLVSADKKWDYALGIIKVDGLEPSPEFKNLIAKEKRGEKQVVKWTAEGTVKSIRFSYTQYSVTCRHTSVAGDMLVSR